MSLLGRQWACVGVWLTSTAWLCAEPATAPAARVGSVTITTDQVQAAAEPRLRRVRAEEFEVRRRVLDELISEELLRQEAARQGRSVAEVLTEEVDRQVGLVTDADVDLELQRRTAVRGRVPAPGTREALRRELVTHRRAARRAEYLRTLRKRADVSVLLQPPRAEVGVGPHPLRGTADAPVTVVVFSDFQCPYCARAERSLRTVLERFPGKVRVAFRDFPLVQIHADAASASGAAYCAQRQRPELFWQMHDRLFAHQADLAPDALKQHAVALGMRLPEFEHCLAEVVASMPWRDDIEEGQALGVTGTPTLFVNGRRITGATTVLALSDAIEEALSPATAIAAPAK